ncbi:MAG: hypothetical protein R2799_14180 [Crocinitomicaceae bacterium]
MKYFVFLASCFLIFFTQAQSDGWKFHELAKGIKISVPSEMERRIVRDMEMHLIEGGNYEWRIITLPLSSFIKDANQVNFLGETANLVNQLMSDPYNSKYADSLFLLKGNPVRSIGYSHVECADTSQNYKVWQYYMLVGEQVFISNLKFFKESKITDSHSSDFFSKMKLVKGEYTEITVKGIHTFFNIDNKNKFLKSVYCNYPEISKSKSYHKILSLNVEFELTETGQVSKVVMDPSKMIMITRESEEELEEFFKKFSFQKVSGDTGQEIRKVNFVLFLQDAAKRFYCN